MDIEKLIERLNQYSQSLIAYKLGADFADACMDAAVALSTLQSENEKLLDENRRWSESTRTLSCAIENLRDELNDLKAQFDMYGGDEGITATFAELEQVKREKDAAVSWVQKYTESIDRPCVACKHNTGDYVCTAICGNCGPMGTKSCKWEFDFSGELKED